MKKYRFLLLCFLAGFIFVSCQQTSDTIDPNTKESKKEKTNPDWLSDDSQISNYLKTLSSPEGLTRKTEVNDPGNDGTPIIVVDEGDKKADMAKEAGEKDGVPGYWVTSHIKYRMSQEFDETLILDPSADILYPGCVIRGESVANSTYAFFNSCSTGVTTYGIGGLTLESGDGHLLQGRNEDIRFNDYRAQYNNWTQLKFKSAPLETTYSLLRMDSKDHAEFHAGVSLKHQLADFVGKLDFANDHHKNHFLVKFIQKKFQVTMDQPRGRSTIFTQINPKALQAVQPVYISNINYGRILFVSVSTDESAATVNSAIQFALNVKGVDAKPELKEAYNKVQSNSDIRLTVVGGGQDIQNEVLSNGFEGVRNYITSNLPMNEAAPISFQMRFASDNAIAKIVSKTSYDVPTRSFVPAFDKIYVQVRVRAIQATGGRYGENEIFGTAYVQQPKTGNNPFVSLPAFSIPREQAKHVNNQNIFTDFEQQRLSFTFVNPDSEKQDIQDFMLKNYLKFNMNLSERWYNGKDDYTPQSENMTLTDLIKIYNSGDPTFTLKSQNSAGYTVGLKFEITNIEFLVGNKRISAKTQK